MWRLLAIIAVTLGLAAGIYFWPHERPAPAAPHAQGKPQRIVCLAPSITETVFALGAGDRVVGVTKWCDYPPEAKTRTVVGGMGMPNLEVLVALKPDLILAPSFGKTEDYEKLRQLGYRVEVEKPQYSLDAVLDGIHTIGAWISEDTAALHLVERLSSEESALRMRIARAANQVCHAAGNRNQPYPGPQYTGVFVVGHDPLYVAGRGTFASDMLMFVGAEMMWEVPGWFRCSLEDLLTYSPEVVFDSTGNEAEVREYWNRWPNLSAVKNGRVYAVDPNLTNRTGPRIVQGLEQMARLLYPEAFSKPEDEK